MNECKYGMIHFMWKFLKRQKSNTWLKKKSEDNVSLGGEITDWEGGLREFSGGLDISRIRIWMMTEKWVLVA